MSSTILVVDDNSVNRTLLTAILTGDGFQSLEAESGEQALNLAREKRPDAVLLDIMMPGMDGFETYRHMKEEGMNAPVIFLTALTESEHKVTGLDLGAEDYITKPFNKDEILARLRSHLKRGGKIRDLKRDLSRREDETAEAARLQMSLAARSGRVDEAFSLASRRRPADRLSCEILVGARQEANITTLVLLDVGQDGISGAMAAVSLARLMNGRNGSLLRPKLEKGPGYYSASPARVITSMIKEFPMGEIHRPASIHVLQLDSANGIVKFATSGPVRPMLAGKGGELTWLDGSVPASNESSEPGIRQGEEVLKKGDRIVMFTDGVFNAMDAESRVFGKLEIANVLRRFKGQSIETWASKIDSAVDIHTAKASYQADRTVAVIEYRP